MITILLILSVAAFCAAMLAVIEGARENVFVDVFGGAASTTGIHAAITDTGATQTITSGLSDPPFPSRITATAGGTAADINDAMTVTVTGTAPGGAAISEVLPAFTENTPGTVTGSYVFETVSQVVLTAHDGTGATTAIGYAGSPQVASTTGVHAAVTDTGVQVVVTTAIKQPDVPRNITATSGGTSGDIKAIQVVLAGTNREDVAITETLPVFTENSPTTVAGAKAFKSVSSITIPAHDGTGATTAVGFGDVIGLKRRRQRKTVLAAYLAETIEGTAPTELVSSTAIESNTVDLNSALNSTQVKVEYLSAEQ